MLPYTSNITLRSTKNCSPLETDTGVEGKNMSEKNDKPVQIGELAKSLDITTRTIRYYEEIGLMGKTERLGGGARSYHKDDILLLTNNMALNFGDQYAQQNLLSNILLLVGKRVSLYNYHQ